jgi:Protein of unknown function (DUF3011)
LCRLKHAVQYGKKEILLMSHRAALAAGILMIAALPVGAQEMSRRANITGRRGDRGKCTIEVTVDGAAEVEVSGDAGRIRTLAGRPAEWRRFQCSDPLPRHPVEFRFVGVDGRGRVELVRDPRENRGVAVVRIQDPQGGREGYTFDLEWRGSGGASEGGRNGRYDRGRQNTSVVACSSNDMRRRYCDADTRGGVRLLKQHSDSACRQGYSWGYDRRGIWVDHGCRADFEVGR